MKTSYKLITIFSFIIAIYSGCEKGFEYKTSLKAVTTKEISNLLQTSATVSGIINTDNGASITERGICYSLTEAPLITDLKKVDVNKGIGDFTCTLNNLQPSKTYFARAYATNYFGTAYGNELSFTTKDATVPILSATTAVSSINQVSARSGGEITNSGASGVISRGVCWSSTNQNPTITDSKTVDGTGVGLFTSTLTNLAPNTRYYVRSYATNGVGTAYGDVKTFSTSLSVIPVVTSVTAPSGVTLTSAISGGTISSDGGATITSRGVCWSTSTTTPTISNTKTIDGTGIGTFDSNLTGLTPNTTYYIRAYATNSVGTSYSSSTSFRTLAASLPSISTISPSSITYNSALSGGNVTNDGGNLVSSRGVCWSSSTTNPTISNSLVTNGSGTGTFSSSLASLTASTTYYVRAYATNSVGTAYGSVLSFTTPSAPLSIGQAHLGGIIAYIYQASDAGYVAGQTHGIITTTGNISTGSQWGCSGTLISTTSVSLTTGAANTSAISSKCSTSTIAANICANYSSGGYSDWFLPSRDELYKLYLNKTAIGSFTSTNYWSSSENTSTSAWSIDFSSGSQVSGNSKSNLFYVRPIKTF